ncbi:hypothetical protein GCM10028791_27000 [Echinicola sediminis]
MGNTIAKSKILQIIKASDHPITYGEIKKQMKDSCSRVTIYRILLRLEKEKLILRFPDANGDFRYANNNEHTNPCSEHSHFHCIKCDTVSCLAPEELNASIPPAYKTESITIVASGICPNCCSQKPK